MPFAFYRKANVLHRKNGCLTIMTHTPTFSLANGFSSLQKDNRSTLETAHKLREEDIAARAATHAEFKSKIEVGCGPSSCTCSSAPVYIW